MSRKKVRKRQSRRRSKNRSASPVLIIILILLLVFVVVEGILIIRDRKESASDYSEKDDRVDLDGEISYSSHYQEEHLVSDPTRLNYVDNELVVQYNRDITEKEAKDLARSYNHSKLVGFISVTGTAQWRLKGSHSKEELLSIAAEIEQDSSVESANLNYVLPVIGSGSYTKESGTWNQDAYRWGYEDIHADSYYDYKNQMKDAINMGILDMGFLEDDDLDYDVLNGFSEYAGEDYNKHGTGVAGIMSAIADNKKGIAGVYPKSNETGHVLAFRVANKSWMQEMDYLARLLLRNCKVINVSLGFEAGMAYSIQKNYEKYGEEGCLVNSYWMLTDLWGKYLRRWIDHGKEFLIISAAGNDSRHSGPGGNDSPTYYLNKVNEPDTNDPDHPIIYTKGKENKDNKNDRYIVNPEFSYVFPMIRDEEVRDRIICVSAYGKVKEHAETAAFSNMGERTDIFAPGYKILTLTGNGNIEWSHLVDDVVLKAGTSDAAPMVTGAAACIWAMDETLTAHEVREILLQQIDGNSPNRMLTDRDTGITRPMLDLKKSLQYTAAYLSHRETPEVKENEQAITIIVKDKAAEPYYPTEADVEDLFESEEEVWSIWFDENYYNPIKEYEIMSKKAYLLQELIRHYESSVRINNAWITITDASGQELYTKESIRLLPDQALKDRVIDAIHFILPKGTYSVELGADGYETQRFTNVQVPDTSSYWNWIADKLNLTSNTVWEFSLAPIGYVVEEPEEIIEDDLPYEEDEPYIDEETWEPDSEPETDSPALNLVGTYSGCLNDVTYYDVVIYSQDSNGLTLDVNWYNMRMAAGTDRVNVSLKGNVVTFTAHVLGGHGIDGDFLFDIQFNSDASAADLSMSDLTYGGKETIKLTKQ